MNSKGAYAYQPQGEGVTDHWLLRRLLLWHDAGRTTLNIATSIPTRRGLLSDARVCRISHADSLPERQMGKRWTR